MASATGSRRREPDPAGFEEAPRGGPRAAGVGDGTADRRPASSLARRLLAINLAPLALFVAAVLYLDNYREGLIAAKIDSLETHGEVIAGALGETVVAEDRDDASRPPLTYIEETQARSLIRRLAVGVGVRARLFREETGEMIADSRELLGVGGVVQSEALPPPGIESGLDRWLRGADRTLLGVTPVFGRYEAYVERAGQTAEDYPEAVAALAGATGHALRDAGRDGLILTVAVPVGHYRQVQGALLLSSTLDDVEAELRDVRGDILGLALLAFAATVLLSVYLAGAIARPVKRLAIAADRVRSGLGEAGSIPDFGGRGDEIGELSRALIDMTRELEQRMVATERFAADVAHEIRNPLSSLRSAIEILPRIEDDERRGALLRVAADDLRRIDRLIADVSDASRLDAELSRAATGPVDIGGLLRSLATVLAATWGEDGPRLALGPDLDRGGSEGRFAVDGVEDRLVQVVRNLLDNARSFSPPGGTVALGCRRRGRWIEVTVADEGPGVPAGKEEAIFERFYSDRPEGEKFGEHSGLGLSISRQIVEAHGGTVAAGDPGENPGGPAGARFVVRLPAAP